VLLTEGITSIHSGVRDVVKTRPSRHWQVNGAGPALHGFWGDGRASCNSDDGWKPGLSTQPLPGAHPSSGTPCRSLPEQSTCRRSNDPGCAPASVQESCARVTRALDVIFRAVRPRSARPNQVSPHASTPMTVVWALSLPCMPRTAQLACRPRASRVQFSARNPTIPSSTTGHGTSRDAGSFAPPPWPLLTRAADRSSPRWIVVVFGGRALICRQASESRRYTHIARTPVNHASSGV
jgi:hypothetical protein